MKRETLALACLFICGCAGRMNTDLLQARIREQATQLSESQREIAKTRTELKLSRLEAERLRSEFAQNGQFDDESTRTPIQISKIHIYPLASGGLNKDRDPGDDAIVVQFAPFDEDNEPIKVPGSVDLVLLDPQLPVSERELGRWSFTANECRDHWTRGITSSGFQFTLPLEQAAVHSNLVVKLQFKTDKDRQYETSQIVKVAVSDVATARNPPLGRKRVQVVNDFDDPPPPVGVADSPSGDDDSSDWDTDEEVSKKPGHTVLHSSNWTDESIPQYR